MNDPVEQAFARLRAEASKHGADLPAKDAYRRRSASNSTAKPSPGRVRPRRLGKKTGLDGRYQPVGRNIESLDSVLFREIRSRGWKKDLSGVWIISHWDQIVGAKIAQHTAVQMIKNKKLFINCDSTAWATNLRLMQKQILQVIADKIGPDTIEELIIFGPQAPSWRKGYLHVKGRGPRDTYG